MEKIWLSEVDHLARGAFCRGYQKPKSNRSPCQPLAIAPGVAVLALATKICSVHHLGAGCTDPVASVSTYSNGTSAVAALSPCLLALTQQ